MDGELRNRPYGQQIDEQVCAAVRAYLAENPRAMDTLEGIVAWWLPRQQIRFDVERVSRALEALAARGLVEEVGVGGTTWYRLKGQPDVGGAISDNESSRG